MPELPEVETICRGLNRLLPGRRIDAIESLWAKSFQAPSSEVEQFLIGSSVVSVQRRAKLLLIGLSSSWSLVIHLKMTGQLVFVDREGQRFGAGHPNDSLIGQLPDRSTRVILTLGSSHLYFNDQRKFGWIQLLSPAGVAGLEFLQKVGPEPLNPDFTANEFVDRLRHRSGSTIKAALLDQTVIAGIGNIYADESLWSAAIHPASRVCDIPPEKLQKLYQGVRDVLELSIAQGGSTDRNYVDAEGRRGAYLDFAAVFRRQGQACRRCGTTIIKTRVAGRGTHLCPSCQVPP